MATGEKSKIEHPGDPQGHRSGSESTTPSVPRIVLSFDVEEHHRIEAAAGLSIDANLAGQYAGRVRPVVTWILDRLAERNLQATFFVLGTIARDQPQLIRQLQDLGHEVASHGWDHRRITAMTPSEFRADLRQSKDALEQAAGAPVVGYRAPTFSIVARTTWALDVLVEEGFLYDSSIYPVRHDRYGIASAPRTPFLASGPSGRSILEVPPATLRLGGYHLPVGGGGYFRLLPPELLKFALRQVAEDLRPAVAMLYFHPWEFDPDQPRLPLKGVRRYRTYVGIDRNRARFESLLNNHRFQRCVDIARELQATPDQIAAVTFGN